jgi:hypothetical protein
VNRRVTTAFLLTLAMSILTAVPALAQDLEEWLERASDAEYTGRQFTVCDTPDGQRVAIVEVSQHGGLIEVTASSGSAVVGPDGVFQRTADGSMSVTSAESLSDWSLADRYSIVFGQSGEVLARPIDVIEVREGERVRLELAFDRQTGAVLEASVFNADESRYCTSSFILFEPSSDEIAPPKLIATVIEPAPIIDERLPESVAGFSLKDAYDGPFGSVTGFYSDGIFSFDLVAADRRIAVQGLENSLAARIGGVQYDRSFAPGQSFHSWETPRGGYVMLGDLPIDLQEAVLAELPKPGLPNFFTRVWKRFFG